jgi:hypothetical protein
VTGEFDPNAPEGEPTNRWASFSDTRNRDRGFKTHTDFTKLRSAIRNCRAIRCFERVDGEWVEVYAHKWNVGGPDRLGTETECYSCGTHFAGYGYWYWSGKEPFAEVKLCFTSKCKRKNGVYKVPDEPLTVHSTYAKL